MMQESDLNGVLERLQNEGSIEELRQEVPRLVQEIVRLRGVAAEYESKILQRVNEIEEDFLKLDAENQRLRQIRESAFVERDFCVALLARLANQLGMMTGVRAGSPVGTVVVNLPSGQVNWDFMESEAHLFESLPVYVGEIEAQTVEEKYMRVMNPDLPPNA